MNMKPNMHFSARIKLTLHTEERFFGPGICELLEKIQETGSIQAAAAEMGMSYSKAWRILNRAEQEMGTRLIIRKSGGREGGSSNLTEDGEHAIWVFREMEKALTENANDMLRAYYPAFTEANGDGQAPALPGKAVSWEKQERRKET